MGVTAEAGHHEVEVDQFCNLVLAEVSAASVGEIGDGLSSRAQLSGERTEEGKAGLGLNAHF